MSENRLISRNKYHPDVTIIKEEVSLDPDTKDRIQTKNEKVLFKDRLKLI